MDETSNTKVMPIRTLDIDVMQALRKRVNMILDEFEHFYVSLSGGKDSGVMVQIIIQEAEKRNRKVPVLFYDWEAVYKETANFVERIMEHPMVIPYWVCLPVTERNGSSLYEPFWKPWDKRKKDLWVRDMPTMEYVINEDNMPDDWKLWHDQHDHDLQFFINFGDWFSRQHGCEKVASFIGIRVDESEDRRKMLRTKKNRIKWDDHDWCYRYKANVENIWYTMPMYDWKVEDIWAAIGKENLDYNHIYNSFYKMGISLSNQRICNPYGEQQKRGLHQYHQCEPETWFKVVNRVSGADFGSRYNKTSLNQGSVEKPVNITWKQYLRILLDSLPNASREHYRHIMARTIWWHRKRSREMNGFKTIYDTKDDFPTVVPKDCKPNNDFVSYRLMCMTIIKGDYWGKKLYFAETKKEKERQKELIKKYDVV